MQTSELAEQLFLSPLARLVAITDGAGAPRVVRARSGDSDPTLSLSSDITSAALSEFAARQRFGALRQAVVFFTEATVVLNALSDGTTLLLIADADANLGLLLSTCRTALTAFGEGGSDGAGR